MHKPTTSEVTTPASVPVSEGDRELACSLLGDFGLSRRDTEKIAAYRQSCESAAFEHGVAQAGKRVASLEKALDGVLNGYKEFRRDSKCCGIVVWDDHLAAARTALRADGTLEGCF